MIRQVMPGFPNIVPAVQKTVYWSSLTEVVERYLILQQFLLLVQIVQTDDLAPSTQKKQQLGVLCAANLNSIALYNNCNKLTEPRRLYMLLLPQY